MPIFYFRILMLEERPIEKYPNLRGTANYPIAHIVTKSFFGQNNYHSYNYFKASHVNDTIINIMEELKNGPTMYIVSKHTKLLNYSILIDISTCFKPRK